MSNTELKVIRAAIRGTRDLIQTLNDGREMPQSSSTPFITSVCKGGLNNA